MIDALSLGGHGIYVWPCYAMAALVLGGLALAPLWRRRRWRRRVAGPPGALRPGEPGAKR